MALPPFKIWQMPKIECADDENKVQLLALSIDSVDVPWPAIGQEDHTGYRAGYTFPIAILL